MDKLNPATKINAMNTFTAKELAAAEIIRGKAHYPTVAYTEHSQDLPSSRIALLALALEREAMEQGISLARLQFFYKESEQ